AGRGGDHEPRTEPDPAGPVRDLLGGSAGLSTHRNEGATVLDDPEYRGIAGSVTTRIPAVRGAKLVPWPGTEISGSSCGPDAPGCGRPTSAWRPEPAGGAPRACAGRSWPRWPASASTTASASNRARRPT